MRNVNLLQYFTRISEFQNNPKSFIEPPYKRYVLNWKKIMISQNINSCEQKSTSSIVDNTIRWCLLLLLRYSITFRTTCNKPHLLRLHLSTYVGSDVDRLSFADFTIRGRLSGTSLLLRIGVVGVFFFREARKNSS